MFSSARFGAFSVIPQICHRWSAVAPFRVLLQWNEFDRLSYRRCPRIGDLHIQLAGVPYFQLFRQLGFTFGDGNFSFLQIMLYILETKTLGKCC
jgi:hypothetical protein